MRAKVRPGPEPMRLRLEMLDVDELAEALREHLVLAQTGVGPTPRRSPRRLLEAVQLAHDAIRARAMIAEGKPVPPRWLAALGNVATSRVRQLLREGGLRWRGKGVEPASAARWLSRAEPRFAGQRRLVATRPSWWGRNVNKWIFFAPMEAVAAPILPSGCTFRFDVSDTPCFEVAPWARLEDPEVEELRSRVSAALEPLGPHLPALPREDDGTIDDGCLVPSRPPPSPPHAGM